MPQIINDKIPNRWEAKELIKQLVEESKIAYSAHCKKRMKERDVTIPDIINCLTKGNVAEDPWINYNYGGGIETSMEKMTAGRVLKIVVCIKWDDLLLIVTVINT